MKRIYRGHCPYESFFDIEFGQDCTNCPNIQKCIRAEKRKRKIARRRRAILLRLSILILVVILIVFAIVFGVWMLVKSQNNTNNTPEVISESKIIETKENDIYLTAKIPYPETSLESSTAFEENTEESINMFSEKTEEKSTLTVKEESTSEDETEAQPYISAYEPGELYYYNLSYEEKVYIAKVVYREARGEIFEGQVAVAAVILNRYVSENNLFDTSSIYAVVTQSGQFASIANVSTDDLKSVPSCMQAVEAACKGWDPTRVKFKEGALFFYNPEGDISVEAQIQRKGIETYRIGNHLFHVYLNPSE